MPSVVLLCRVLQYILFMLNEVMLNVVMLRDVEPYLLAHRQDKSLM